MFVCICNSVTDREIREAVGRGARSVRDLKRELGVATGCGSCACLAKEIVDETKGSGLLASAGALPAGAFLKPEG